MKNLLLVALTLLASVTSVTAGDVYIFQAHSEGPPVFDPAADGAEIMVWDTDAFFFNQGTTDAQVKLLDEYQGMEFTIPPQHSASLSSHANVWIYNGGFAATTAHVEVRRQCDDAVVQEATVTIEAKRSANVSGLASGFRGCAVPASMRSWSADSLYTIVSVDQPSLSFVSSVANGQIPKALVSVN